MSYLYQCFIGFSNILSMQSFLFPCLLSYVDLHFHEFFRSYYLLCLDGRFHTCHFQHWFINFLFIPTQAALFTLYSPCAAIKRPLPPSCLSTYIRPASLFERSILNIVIDFLVSIHPFKLVWRVKREYYHPTRGFTGQCLINQFLT